jgi:hypothetical protein
VDECATNQFSCASNAKCVNNVGSYTCECLSGYTGDGKSSCSGKDKFIVKGFKSLSLSGLTSSFFSQILMNARGHLGNVTEMQIA